MTVDRELKRLHIDLNCKRLSRNWGKLEILLGLAGFVGGLLIAEAPGMISPTNLAAIVLGGAIVATLGGYLSLAGHRSHLYQSNVKLAAWIIHRSANQPDSQSPQIQIFHATDRPNLSGSYHS